MRNETDDWKKCLNNSNAKEGNVCVDCMSSYTLLANQYSLLEKGSNGVCFEVVDQVKSGIRQIRPMQKIR